MTNTEHTSPTAQGIRAAIEAHPHATPAFAAALHCWANALDDEARRQAEAAEQAEQAEARRHAELLAQVTPEMKARVAARRAERKRNG